MIRAKSQSTRYQTWFSDGEHQCISDTTADKATTSVSLDRTRPDEVVFQYEIELDGDLKAEQRDSLLRAAGACPVRRTFSPPPRTPAPSV